MIFSSSAPAVAVLISDNCGSSSRMLHRDRRQEVIDNACRTPVGSRLQTVALGGLYPYLRSIGQLDLIPETIALGARDRRVLRAGADREQRKPIPGIDRQPT